MTTPLLDIVPIKICQLRHEHQTYGETCPTIMGRRYSCGCLVKVTDDSPMPNICPTCGNEIIGMEQVHCDLPLYLPSQIRH
jgi:hypothetical protein